jgi:signal transduction histidine kinase
MQPAVDPQSRIERLSVLVGGSSGPTVAAEFREARRARANELIRAGEGELAVLEFAADMVSAVAPELVALPHEAERLIDAIADTGGVTRVSLGREVLRDAQLVEMPADLALETQLTLCRLFTGVEAVSLWTIGDGGERRPVASSGDISPDSATEAGVTFSRWQGGRAALVAHGSPRGEDHRSMLLEAAAPAVRATLERELLRSATASGDQDVLGTVERRLARLRFDLHDGPQQDVHLLAADLHLFREQLLPIISSDPNAERVLGRLDDLAAQLVALDGDLRRLASSFQSPFLHVGSLAEAMAEITSAFAERTGIEPDARLTGDFSSLTESQRLTLLALVREALSNAREHSAATHVSIAIEASVGGVRAEVVDDGRGFDPDTTLVRAARDGHLGLVGMHERVRMLGGVTHIDSRPGGPTVISVTLPPWPEPE